MAEPEEIEAEQKKIESIFNPIMMKVYQSSGSGMGGDSEGARGRSAGGVPYGESPGKAPPSEANVEDLD
jgi:hypothetical protein